MSEVTFHKERLHWVDVAKGILIVMVAMVHLTGKGEELGISCPAIDAIGPMASVLCFRMPAFFILAGFWGRYDMSFKDFLLRNAKGLLLPLIIFSFLGGVLHEVFYEILKGSYNAGTLEWPFLDTSLDYWFVLALFLAKCVYWLVCRISSKQYVRLLVCLAIYAVGVLSLKAWFLPNFACWKWALIMLVYLPIGQWVREHLKDWKLFVAALIVFVAGWVIYWWLDSGIPQPGGGMKYINLVSAWPSLLLCTAGSVVFFKLCSYIKRARVLELIGRNTLAIYVMHWWIEILAMKVMRGFFAQGVWLSTTATLVTLALAVFVPCLISELLNRPKLKWILGK
jgi:fucose 4-O-acetylase-like acetyltransferase